MTRLRPVPVPSDTLTRLAALDARCDWSVRRGTRRDTRVYYCRIWERDAPREYLEGSSSTFYRSTMADALFAIVIVAEQRGWHRPK